MNVSNLIATNLKEIREQKKLTLDAAAELTGVSRSMLAHLEKGDVNPTISVLWKIANGFKVTFTSLMQQKAESVAVIRKEDLSPLVEDDGKFVNYPIYLFDEHRSFESYRVVIKPSGQLHAQPHLKGTEEYITIFAGEADITVDQTAYHLSCGDSIRFMADVPHSYANNGKTTTEMSMVIDYHQ